jgi:hypothetical protein
MPANFRNAVLLCILVAVCLVASCSTDPFADEVSAEDQRVMRTMIDISCKLGVERLVVSDQPAIPPRSDLRASGARNVQFGIDLSRRVAHVARWRRGRVCPVVRVVADARINAVLASDTPGWDAFISTFDGARSLMKISLPVYSADGKHAVVYTTGSCPYRCGAGFYHELAKANSGWHIVRSVNAWKS